VGEKGGITPSRGQVPRKRSTKKKKKSTARKLIKRTLGLTGGGRGVSPSGQREHTGQTIRDPKKKKKVPKKGDRKLVISPRKI